MSELLSQTDDGELMRRAQRGEVEAFAALYRRYRGPLARVAESRLGRSDWAEDVVQETFLAAFKSRRTFDPRANFRTWLWTILLRQCHRHYHERQRGVRAMERLPRQPSAVSADEVRLHELLVSCEPPPPEHAIARERRALLAEVLAQLPFAQADALRLRFFGALKFREIAETMECSLLTAKNRVRSGLLKMAELLQSRSVSGVSLVDDKDLL